MRNFFRIILILSLGLSYVSCTSDDKIQPDQETPLNPENPDQEIPNPDPTPNPEPNPDPTPDPTPEPTPEPEP